jgi:hypothetical protein
MRRRKSEERYWAREGERRLRTFKTRDAMTHTQAWGARTFGAGIDRS